VLEIAAGARGTGKTDFNFNVTGKPFDGTHWTSAGPDSLSTRRSTFRLRTKVRHSSPLASRRT